MLWENSIIIINHDWWENELVKIKTDLVYLAFGYIYEIRFYKVKKKLNPVVFCCLFLQEMRMGNIPMLSKSFTFDVLLDWKSNIKKFDIMPGTACIS